MSSDLMDEGYGSFDRCFSALRVARGDLTEAKVILSSLMMAENSFLNWNLLAWLDDDQNIMQQKNCNPK